MVTDVSEYKYLNNWYEMYEQARDSGLLSTYADMPKDLALQGKWIDPCNDSIRFFPVNY